MFKGISQNALCFIHIRFLLQVGCFDLGANEHDQSNPQYFSFGQLGLWAVQHNHPVSVGILSQHSLWVWANIIVLCLRKQQSWWHMWPTPRSPLVLWSASTAAQVPLGRRPLWPRPLLHSPAAWRVARPHILFWTPFLLSRLTIEQRLWRRPLHRQLPPHRW